MEIRAGVGQEDGGALSAAAATDTSSNTVAETEATPGLEKLATGNAYLKHEFTRSEAYRKRIEEVKDLNAAMHRTIIREVEEARLEILQKDDAGAVIGNMAFVTDMTDWTAAAS